MKKTLLLCISFLLLISCSNESEESKEAIQPTTELEPTQIPEPTNIPQPTPTMEPDPFGPAEIIRTNIILECTEGTFGCGFDVRLSRPPTDPVNLTIVKIDGKACSGAETGVIVATLKVGETLSETNWDVGQGVGFHKDFHESDNGIQTCIVTYAAQGAKEFEALESFTYTYTISNDSSVTSADPPPVPEITESWEEALLEAGCTHEWEALPDNETVGPYWYWNCELRDLTGINLAHAQLYDPRFGGVILNEADLSESVITSPNSNPGGADFSGAFLIGANLDGAIISNAWFIGANLTEASLVGTTLNHVAFLFGELVGVNLSESQGDETSFYDADLTGANLSYASFPNGVFELAYLTNAVFDNTDLSDVDFRNVDLTDVDLTNAILTNAIFD